MFKIEYYFNCLNHIFVFNNYTYELIKYHRNTERGKINLNFNKWKDYRYWKKYFEKQGFKLNTYKKITIFNKQFYIIRGCIIAA